MRLVVLVAAAVLLAPSVGLAQFPPPVDDFEDQTLENWVQGFSAPGTGLVNVAGGPAGSTRYMQITSFGGLGGSGSRLTAFNQDQWRGNYIAAGVTAVEMDLFAPASNPQTLSIRIAFKSSTGQFAPGYSSTTPFTLPADGQWHHAVFPLTADTMTPINSPTAFSTFMTNPLEMRILHSAAPDTNGDVIAAVVGADNIRVVPVPEPAGVLAVAAVVVGLARVVARRRRMRRR